MRPIKRKIAWGLGLIVLLVPLLWPERARIPVEGATPGDWNRKSFWYEPWGASGVHKGIDIFAPAGRPVVAAVPGAVIFRGRLGLGGNVVAVLGPKWRIHYFAHLQESNVHLFELVSGGEVIGKVGTSGNAAGKPPHLHYAILQLLPQVWKATRGTQGWKRMFFVDPGQVIAAVTTPVGASDDPVPIEVGSRAFAMNGIIYETRSELVTALRELKPKALRVRPAPDTSYDAVAEAVRAIQESGVDADLGFRGNLADE